VENVSLMFSLGLMNVQVLLLHCLSSIVGKNEKDRYLKLSIGIIYIMVVLYNVLISS
jgi:Ca2+/Na+ antiporter